MKQRRKILFLYISTIFVILFGYSVAYMWGMRFFEGVDTGFFEALDIVIQSMTTTGYGQDSEIWSSAPMHLMTISMQVTGIVLVFMTLPLFIVPLIEESLQRRTPEYVEGFEDHIVICGFSSQGEALVDELESQEIDYVIVESDIEKANELYEEGMSVIYGDPELIETLENACIGSAKAVVVDSTDEKNATIVLSVREVNPDVRVVSLVEDPSLEPYLRYAGADDVLSPRHILGRSLANKATTAVSAELDETVDIGKDFELVELSVQKGSELCDIPLSETNIRRKTGASVIGVWVDGEFIPSPPPETEIDENTVLLVAGKEKQLENFKSMTLSEGKRHLGQKIIVAGFGEVGSMVAKELERSRTPYTVVDIEEKDGVDVVGDVTHEEVLKRAGIEDSSVIIVALSDDSKAIFTTLVTHEIDSATEIIVRANEVENVGKMYRAGADYVLSLTNVSGRMLASKVLEEDIVSLNKQIKIVRVNAPGLVGKSFEDAEIQSRTGCVVIAVERNGEVLTDLGPDFAPEKEDTLVVAGDDNDINRFESEFC